MYSCEKLGCVSRPDYMTACSVSVFFQAFSREHKCARIWCQTKQQRVSDDSKPVTHQHWPAEHRTHRRNLLMTKHQRTLNSKDVKYRGQQSSEPPRVISRQACADMARNCPQMEVSKNRTRCLRVWDEEYVMTCLHKADVWNRCSTCRNSHAGQ